MVKIASAALLSGALLVAGGIHAQATPPSCDKQFKPQAGQWPYGPRGDRCEGLYETAVSATGGLRPVSLTDGDISLRVGSQDLWWTAPSADTVTSLTVTSFSALYRMDVIVKGAQYRWPTDVVLGTRMTPGYLGIVAVTQETLKSRNKPVYHPVSFRPKDAGPHGKYILKIAAPEDLDDLSYEVSRLTPAGDVDGLPIDQGKVSLVYYSAAISPPIRLDLSKMPSGLYQVDVDGRRMAARSGRTAMSFLLRHGS